ncbi:hypothetical protein KY284_007583 [Solanum tuberosum]|nr:hypothetical protein KY284_007583 [Solanum tuberosum]
MHTEVTANKIAQISGYCYGSFIEGRTIEEIGLLLSEIESVKIDVTVHKVKQTSTYLMSSLSTNNPGLNEEMESFQKAMDQVKKQLLGGLHQLDVISLVGMPEIEDFIDDVWDDKVWDNLYMCFKDARIGSRFILTTRLSNVANYAKCESEPHYLLLFRDDEGWTLLQQELFQGKLCPPEIVDVNVGFRIAKEYSLEMSMEYRLFVHSSEDQIDLWQNVLDLKSFNIGGTFPSEVQFLIHLKIGRRGDISFLYSNYDQIGHLLVKNYRASFSLHENMGESLTDSQLDNLKIFSTPHLSYGEDTKMMLRNMPKLRELSCIFSGTFGYSEKVEGRCVRFPRLEYLSHLESLKLVSNNYQAKLPHVFSFPSRLRELILSKFRLPWSQILIFGELPNLEILKLILRAFEGDEWEVKDSEFRELKYLELEDGVSLKNIEVNWCHMKTMTD